MGRLHDVALGHATMVGVHGVATAWLEVLNIAKPELAATVLVTLELGDGSIRCLGSIESNDTGASGAAAWLVLDLGLLNLADGSEQLDQILVTSGPRKLRKGVSEYDLYEIAVEQGVHD